MAEGTPDPKEASGQAGAPPLMPPACLTPEGYLRMLPHVHGTDGAFAARMRRAAAT